MLRRPKSWPLEATIRVSPTPTPLGLLHKRTRLSVGTLKTTSHALRLTAYPSAAEYGFLFLQRVSSWRCSLPQMLLVPPIFGARMHI